MYTDLFEALKLPDTFEKSKENIWTNEEFSPLVLESHLDDNLEGASRDNDYIEEEVKFISSLAPFEDYESIIDLGCGPGIYAEKLSHLGYKVTGYDFSENSINYAKENAKKQNLDISYKIADLVDFSTDKKFDLALLIYQIYGLFEPKERKKILNNIYNSLHPKGLLLLDVLSEKSYNEFEESQIWSFTADSNKFVKESMLGFFSRIKYPNKVTLQKTTMLNESSHPLTFNYWNAYFNAEDIEQEANEAGFNLIKLFSNLKGEDDSNSNLLAIVLEKND